MRHDTIIADCAIGGKGTSWMPRKGEVLSTQRLPVLPMTAEDRDEGDRAIRLA